MIDENAFGLFIAYHGLEDDEYGLEPDAFAARLGVFRELVTGWLRAERLGDGVQAVDLGHALYCEVASGDEDADPFAWLKGLRARLAEASFTTVAVLSYGGRWVAPEGVEADLPGITVLGEMVVCRVANSSEPLRKALHVDTAAQSDDDVEGWGPGLYVDTEALEALGKKLKNTPTPLAVAGGTYYRIGS